MEKAKQLEKYKLNPEDWESISLVDAKMKAETVVSLFLILENTLASCISPEESELIDSTKTKLLEYLDKNFINNK